MTLTTLNLQNFRSYAKKTFEFSPETTLIVGPNTAGKTNLLEAIFLLATGKSFRADQDRETIRWENEVAFVTAEVTPINQGAPRTREEQIKLRLVLTNGETAGQRSPLKKYLVNGVPRRQLDFVGNLRVTLFWPEDLELVTDSPSLRRRYLDSVLVQVDREYRRNLISYERGLRQRNRLLDLINEGQAHRHQLDFWNELLIRAGGYLTDRRAKFIDYVNNSKLLIHGYQLIYDKSVISMVRLDQYKDEEVAAKATLVGPHRDDIVFKLNEMDLSKYGSRGEQRLAILWLKLAEMAFIEKETGDKPLLLLDDILSELDAEHRDLVFEVIGEQQTVITSADDKILSELKKGSNTKVIQLPARK